MVASTRLIAAATLAAGVSGACRGRAPAPPIVPEHSSTPAIAGTRPAGPFPHSQAASPHAPRPKDHDTVTRPLRRCFPDRAPWIEAPVDALLDRARTYLDQEDPAAALACAEEAARQAPRSIEAHHDRAVAFIRLDRFDEARDTLALALALTPNDSETLDLAADFFINHLAPSAERAALGFEYARRGRQYAPAGARALRGHLALLEGQALIDLGRATEARKPLAIAARDAPQDPAVHYETGVALFELCRFDEAGHAFAKVLSLAPGHAHALFHIGLIAERASEDATAQSRFAEATARDPKAFPAMPSVTPTQFAERLAEIVARLPDDTQRDLLSVSLEPAEIPEIDDLLAELPPLSPTILGLYRGLPLGREFSPNEETGPLRSGRVHQSGHTTPPRLSTSPSAGSLPRRSIVLFRRNILRSIHRADELDDAIQRTLLHEIGHLRGEDDGSLRARGLE